MDKVGIQTKEIPIQELISVLKRIETAILGRVLEEINNVNLWKMIRRNEYHKHSKEEKTIVT